MMLGVAASSAQIEGGWTHSNWDRWSEKGMTEDGSEIRKSCDHWNHYKEDIDIMAAMGVESYKFGVEWARVCPAEGRVDADALRHYRNEILRMKERGIRPLLVIVHFALPAWFEAKGGFLKPENAKYYLAYVRTVVSAFGDLVSDYVTFDEPNYYACLGYLGQGFPPGESSLMKARRVLAVMAGCHIRAYERIHRMREKRGYTDTKVGISLNMRAFAAMNPLSGFESREALLEQYMYQDAPAKAFLKGEFGLILENLGGFEKGVYADFTGFSYYERSHVVKIGDHLGRSYDPKSDAGREIYPQGIVDCAKEIHQILPRPIWILGNGVSDSADAFRALYIYDHFDALVGAKLPVERYYYRSFLDGFEWLRGRTQRYGLVGVDYDTEERTVRKSGQFYRELIKSRGVTQDMIARYLKNEQYHR